MRTCFLAAIALLTALGQGASASFELILDGGFESPAINPASFLTVDAGQTTLAPWVVGLTSVDLVSENGGNLIGPAYDGTQFLDLNGTPGPGQITQTFATTPGQLYALTFAYSDNYFAPSAVSASVRVFDGSGDLLGPTTIVHDTAANGNLDWRVFSGTFLALGSSASLEFQSLTGGDAGILLDGISITPVPEPSSLVLGLLGAAGAIALHARRRRRSAGR